jgi:RHS repeat-associated protein
VLRDSSAGLLRFGVRDYDSFAGRWTSKDPIGFKGGINIVEYASGDPVNWIDAYGTDPGKRFVGPDGQNQAAIDALLWLLRTKNPAVGPPSPQEWGGNVCKLQGLSTYFCPQPTPGPMSGGSHDPAENRSCPSGSDKVADYHTHPLPEMQNKPIWAAPFSQADVNLAGTSGEPQYVGLSSQQGYEVWYYQYLMNSHRVYP